MDLLNLIYTFFIGPLELFFEVVFFIAYRFIGDPGLSIIFLSLAMNFLVLPLYRRADAMQEAERDRANAMKHWTEHIKKTFTGDERFMMLQTYQRQCGYKPTDALRGSVSLLLEIPFFIAAYHFLSNLAVLRGVPFGPIADLGAPDALLAIGGLSINVLPILMTAINFVSAAIYMKGFPLKSKVQMYGIAIIFLVLLYASPAGLVFYWTLNNLFSLVKNIFYKLRNPQRVLFVLASVVGICLFGVAVLHHFDTPKKAVFVAACAILLQLPLVLDVLRGKGKLPKLDIPDATPDDDRTFLFGCLFLAALTGLLIPCSVIQSSPTEFVDATAFRSPLLYVLDSSALALGTFGLWFGVFYRLATPRGKSIFCVGIWAFAGMAVVNYLFFGTGYGTMSPLLQFDSYPTFSALSSFVNLAVLVVVGAVLYQVWKRKRSIPRVAFICMCIAVVAMSAVNMVGIQSELEPMRTAIAESQADDEPHFTLSKNGRNVVVIMMDRAISYYVPFIMNEKPELAKTFAGFTYYPNAVSFGAYTNTGVPALYGGYDYTPERINERADDSLREKQNESLKVMPALFSENGFDTTVFDPTYAGYSQYPDLSIYNDYPDVHKYVTMNGRFMGESAESSEGYVNKDALLSRNFFCYSLFRIAPLVAQPTLYEQGNYNSTATLRLDEGADAANGQTIEDLAHASGLNELFMKSYTVLERLPEMTRISDGDDDNFLMMSNDTSHEPTLLQEPAYTPEKLVDNTAYETAEPKRTAADGRVVDFAGDSLDRDDSKTLHYHVNMATLAELGDWFEYMKQNGVYDNTRIIIVSDHGRNLGLDESQLVDGGSGGSGGDFGNDSDGGTSGDTSQKWDMLMFNCMLMVKDFDADTFTEDDTFMTNADTPSLALDGLIDNPVNPFTGNPITSAGQKDGELHLLWPSEISVYKNNGNTFFPGEWFSVHDNAFDSSNWRYLGRM